MELPLYLLYIFVLYQRISANHRSKDALFLESCEEKVVVGRFAYGPLDVVSLTGEKVDIYLKSPVSFEIIVHYRLDWLGGLWRKNSLGTCEIGSL